MTAAYHLIGCQGRVWCAALHCSPSVRPHTHTHRHTHQHDAAPPPNEVGGGGAVRDGRDMEQHSGGGGGAVQVRRCVFLHSSAYTRSRMHRFPSDHRS